MGSHEAEVSLDGEAGLDALLMTCSKHPGHTDFVPVSQFSMGHLPEEYQDDDIYQLVRTLAELTVRVRVTYTSPSRPEHNPRNNAKYPFYEYRGGTLMRTGTGRIWGVRKYANERCPCETCKRSEEPSLSWGRVYLYTATHVVFDNSEGASADVTWGYDDGEDRLGAAVMKGEGAGVIGDMERDRCTLTCVTCRMELVDKLADLVAEYRRRYAAVYDKYSASERDDHRLTVVVSHPHGCAKTVTVGRWTDRQKFSDDRGLIDTTYTYTAATCAGSSGAPVYVLGKVWYTLAHSGSSIHGNHSGGGWGI